MACDCATVRVCARCCTGWSRFKEGGGSSASSTFFYGWQWVAPEILSVREGLRTLCGQPVTWLTLKRTQSAKDCLGQSEPTYALCKQSQSAAWRGFACSIAHTAAQALGPQDA